VRKAPHLPAAVSGHGEHLVFPDTLGIATFQRVMFPRSPSANSHFAGLSAVRLLRWNSNCFVPSFW
jgi:hypothetical protein